MKNPVKIVKFMKIHQTGKIFTKDGQRETVLKLAVPPNLLKKENVCFIPREAEHPIMSQPWLQRSVILL